MQKARSRLKHIQSDKKEATSTSSESAESPKKAFLQHHQSDSLLKKYLKHLPILFLGLIFFSGVFLLITKVYPEQIRHILLPNSYLPLLAPLFFANFFLLSFLLLNTRRGFFLSSIATILLFLKLQNVIFTPQLLLSILIPFVIIELLAITIARIKHANIRKKSH